MWNPDVFLAVVGGAAQLVLAYLGLTLSRKYKAVFVICALVGIVTIALITRRGVEASNRMDSRLSGIEQSESVLQSQNANLQERLGAFLSRTEVELKGLHGRAPATMATLQADKSPSAQPSARNEVNASTAMGIGISDYATAVVTQSPEHIRRNGIIEALRRKYILSHDSVSPGVIAGKEWPPLDWINGELSSMREGWKACPLSQSELDVMCSGAKKP